MSNYIPLFCVDVITYPFPRLIAVGKSAVYTSNRSSTNMLSTLRLRQKDQHFADDISSAFSWMKIFLFWYKFHRGLFLTFQLAHWGRVTHICIGKLTTIGSDNGLSPGQRQAIIWTNAGILWIRPLWTNFSEILIRIQIFSFKKIHLKMSSAKWRPFVSASIC